MVSELGELEDELARETREGWGGWVGQQDLRPRRPGRGEYVGTGQRA